ncbi:hypothetical protein HD806DRAFT_488167 [Xylariaceae sp. AK1471]|nr:hypothetical protein HD806DRAFT_488167 [Xylariaceae sp. AK1471]
MALLWRQKNLVAEILAMCMYVWINGRALDVLLSIKPDGHRRIWFVYEMKTRHSGRPVNQHFFRETVIGERE